jgi:hypothetical protein
MKDRRKEEYKVMSDLLKITEGSVKHSKEGGLSVTVKQKKQNQTDGRSLCRVKYPQKIPGTKEPKKQKKR